MNKNKQKIERESEILNIKQNSKLIRMCVCVLFGQSRTYYLPFYML